MKFSLTPGIADPCEGSSPGQDQHQEEPKKRTGRPPGAKDTYKRHRRYSRKGPRQTATSSADSARFPCEVDECPHTGNPNICPILPAWHDDGTHRREHCVLDAAPFRPRMYPTMHDVTTSAPTLNTLGSAAHNSYGVGMMHNGHVFMPSPKPTAFDRAGGCWPSSSSGAAGPPQQECVLTGISWGSS